MEDIEIRKQQELRKIQAIHGNTTFVLVLPKDFIAELKIAKGDYVKCRVSNKQLIVEKVEL
jgi:antitoxin component of MazEF toxin-antitoxin module